MTKGNISVQTENIFPIIKQFLYSDQEIFLRELVSNAVDATVKLRTLASKGIVKGEIGDTTIEIILDKENKTLTISDKGIGMSKEVTKRVFETFFRATSGNIHDVKGFGLGLSYVKAIVDMHNGQIEVQSELGKGSSFIIRLPILENEKA